MTVAETEPSNHAAPDESVAIKIRCADDGQATSLYDDAIPRTAPISSKRAYVNANLAEVRGS